MGLYRVTVLTTSDLQEIVISSLQQGLGASFINTLKQVHIFKLKSKELLHIFC